MFSRISFLAQLQTSVDHKRCVALDLGDGNKQQPYYCYTQTVHAGDTRDPGPAGSSCRHGTAAGHLQPSPDSSSSFYSGQVHVQLHGEECQTLLQVPASSRLDACSLQETNTGSSLSCGFQCVIILPSLQPPFFPDCLPCQPQHSKEYGITAESKLQYLTSTHNYARSNLHNNLLLPNITSWWLCFSDQTITKIWGLLWRPRMDEPGFRHLLCSCGQVT